MKKIYLPDSYNFISAYITFRCNLRCGFCVNQFYENGFKKNVKELSGDKWVEALNRIESCEKIPVSFVGGESSLHEDFIYIIKNLKPELGIDIFTNLWWNDNKLEKFIREVPPEKIDNHSPFPSIRASYHPEQMGEGEKLLENVIRLKEAGFDVGIEGVMYPSPFQLEALERMVIRCRNSKISFRPKSFIGIYEGNDDLGRPFSIIHGNYSKYPDSTFNDKTKRCECKTSNLLIAPDCMVYRCQRDLFSSENPTGNLLNPDFQISDEFRPCNKYGQCHPCDVKVTTNNKQELGNTLVEIKDIRT